MIPDRIAHYRILTKLGAGGMGEVYLAEDTRLGRKVALKILPADLTKNEDRLRRFEQEARAASALNHPNILTIHEIGQVEELHFIVTEFVEGETLRQRIESTRMSVSDVMDVSIQLASALAAHQVGIVHRDIKPENIMLRRDGYVKVLDFGLAKLTAKGHERQLPLTDPEAATMIRSDTDPGSVMGTVRYMSPEQTRGLDVDERSDLFSLGVVMYEMIAGRPPFEGLSSSDVVASILDGNPPPLARYARDVPEELEWILEKALRKNREERYQTVKELLTDLKSLKQRLEAKQLERATGSNVSVDAAHTSVNRPMSAAAEAAGPSRDARSAGSARRRSRKTIDSVAVLPFLNASADLDTEYLSDGITETLINSLSRLPKLRVVPRSTVFRYKGREVDPQEVGRALGVRAVLAGRVLHRGDRLIIGTELVDVANESQLWGEQYSRNPSDIFALQEEISREIVERLRLQLTGEEKKRLAKRHTENTEAYHLYLKGRYYSSRFTEEGVKRGIEYFHRSIDVDPSYALAYAGLADAYYKLGLLYMPPREIMPNAKAAATKALEIDEALAEARASLAWVRVRYEWDWLGAESEFKRAIDLNPHYAPAREWYGLYLMIVGRTHEALTELERARELDPLSLIIHAELGLGLQLAGRYDEAIEQLQNTVDMDPNYYVSHWFLGIAYQQKNEPDRAIAEFQKALTLSGGSPMMLALVGYAHAGSGNRDEAENTIRKLKELSGQRYISPINIALIYGGLQEKDRMFEWLERAYDERSPWLVWLKVHPQWVGFRSDVRFQELLRRVGFPP